MFITLTILGLAGSFFLDTDFGIIILVYYLLMIAYSLILKNIVILDILVVAIGFVFRAISGAIVIHVEISQWLLVCTLFLALFLVLGKRRHELILLGDNVRLHRDSFSKYNTYTLDQMISVVTASTVMAYALYTMSSHTKELFGNNSLIYTIPFVIYGVFRYIYLVHHQNQGVNRNRHCLLISKSS